MKIERSGRGGRETRGWRIHLICVAWPATCFEAPVHVLLVKLGHTVLQARASLLIVMASVMPYMVMSYYGILLIGVGVATIFRTVISGCMTDQASTPFWYIG